VDLKYGLIVFSLIERIELTKSNIDLMLSLYSKLLSTDLILLLPNNNLKTWLLKHFDFIAENNLTLSEDNTLNKLTKRIFNKMVKEHDMISSFVNDLFDRIERDKENAKLVSIVHFCFNLVLERISKVCKQLVESLKLSELLEKMFPFLLRLMKTRKQTRVQYSTNHWS